jgi:hypothetical protein
VIFFFKILFRLTLEVTGFTLRAARFKMNKKIYALPTQCILDAFATLQKATTSFVISVCLSVRMEQLGRTGLIS